MGAPQARRLRVLVDRPARKDGAYVLYWMTAARRTRFNFGLQRAARLARELDRPLLVFEPLRAGYRWANARHHAFVIAGMRDNARACAERGVRHLAYVEPRAGDGRGLLAALARDACAVVADDWPCFFLPHMLAAAAGQVDARLEAVDSCGLVPIDAPGQSFPTAYAFRRWLQKNLRPYLDDPPAEDPLALAPRAQATIAAAIEKRWTAASDALLDLDARALAKLPIDHDVAPVARRGGSLAARAALDEFVRVRLSRYGEERSEPASGASSSLSPWLHYGQLSTHEVLAAVAKRAGWKPADVSDKASGKKEGWWNMGASAEAFLDELVTWRELGHVFCRFEPQYERYDSLPQWAQRSLDEHARDPREHVYTVDELAAARTHDPLWNAAQRELLRDGVIHNYLRMLWGKKVLEWSASPRAALDALIELNNRYAIDGRDPNSYSGIFWCLGRFDRPWAPVRPIFGCIRYMSSQNTARKLDVEPYLARYAS